MKSKISYRFKLLLKIVLLLALGFLLINSVMWIFFRNEVRNIGHYLYFRNPEEAVLLIADYMGDPPSRIKARILAQSYNLTIIYSEDGSIIWVAQRRARSFGAEPPGRGGGMDMRGRGMGMHGMDMGDMERMMEGMMRGKNLGPRWEVNVSGNRVVTVMLPMRLHRRYFYNPFYFFFAVLAIIILFIFLSLKKTLRPLDRVIEASDRIGQGDLSHRIRYDRDDDFRKVADAFNTMAVRLSSILTNQRELLQFISHELRTPLARINLALELEDRKRSREIIKNEITEIDTLVGEVSELSRLDNMDSGVNRVRIDLIPLLKSLIHDTGEKRAAFEHGPRSALILAHELLIKKAFANLIDNALKYSDKHEPVLISLKADGTDYIVSVQNGGPGLTEREIENIWEPFFRGTNASKRNIEGRGLGLVIVKKAIELSSGEISVQSSPKGPTQFHVKLHTAR
jgi:signal transduction histidine kinase